MTKRYRSIRAAVVAPAITGIPATTTGAQAGRATPLRIRAMARMST